MKNKITLACIFFCFIFNHALAQTTIEPNISPDSYLLETPTYSAEFINDLLNRIVELENYSSSLEKRIFEMEKYLNAYTSPSEISARAQETTTQQATTTNTSAANTSAANTDAASTSTANTGTANAGTTSETDYSNYYYLQVGAYQKADRVAEQKQTLEQYGYDVYESTNGNIYRLFVGPFPYADLEGTRAALKELGIESFPVQ